MHKKFDPYITQGILFTDQYQLVMAQLYFKLGFHNRIVQFDHFFRNYPNYGVHKAGYCVNAGLEWFIDWMMNSSFGDKELNLMRGQKSSSGKPLFEEDFLNWLKENGNFKSLSLTSIEEGRIIHPNLPITVVKGPLAMAQILETALLNQINYQTLIATKASRIYEAGRGQLLLEFGARRGQDFGANAGVRGALIGGAHFSSNVGISYSLGFPPKGTHAHSLIQFFIADGASELDAFQAFADLYPDDCILLVDTVNTLESGIPNAIKVFENLKKKGHKPGGVRLDSGDLAYLSIQAAKQLNDAGFNDVNIVLSNELDEMNIWQILTQISEEAPKYGINPDNLTKRLIYGVGTRLITSRGDAALGGVYKLTSILNAKKEWIPAIKISETTEKIPNPGDKNVWRIYDNHNKATADILTLPDENPTEMKDIILHHPSVHGKQRIIHQENISSAEKLHTEILRDGKIIYNFPAIEELREKRIKDIQRLDSGVKRLINPHQYHVSLSDKLWKMKEELISEMKVK